jgi:predicted transcriptional regulator
VRQVKRALDEGEPTGYTTVLKLMQIMHEKGLLERDESERPQIYRPAARKADVQRGMVSDFLQSVFEGSLTQLVNSALATKRASREERDAIKKILSGIEEK